MSGAMSGVSSFEDSDVEVPNLHLSKTLTSSPLGHSTPRTNHGQKKRKSSKDSQSRDKEMIKILKSLEEKMGERMTRLEEKMDERMTRMEEKVDVHSVKPRNVTIKPALPLREAVRAGYAAAIEKGLIWHYGRGKKWTDAENLPMTQEIKKSVVGQVDGAPEMELAVATSRYYKSKTEESQRDNNKHKQTSKMYQRRSQKAKRRRGVIDKHESFSDNKKSKAHAAMHQQYMSDEEEEDGIMVVRPLAWESSTLRKIKKRLDAEYKLKASKKSTGQIRERRRGEVSNRPAPTVCANLSWMLQ